MTFKNLTCRLCNASFIPDFKNQQYCKYCLEMTDIRSNSDFSLNLWEKEVEVMPETERGKNKKWLK